MRSTKAQHSAPAQAEADGLDAAQHGEQGWDFR